MRQVPATGARDAAVKFAAVGATRGGWTGGPAARLSGRCRASSARRTSRACSARGGNSRYYGDEPIPSRLVVVEKESAERPVLDSELGGGASHREPPTALRPLQREVRRILRPDAPPAVQPPTVRERGSCDPLGASGRLPAPVAASPQQAPRAACGTCCGDFRVPRTRLPCARDRQARRRFGAPARTFPSPPAATRQPPQREVRQVPGAEMGFARRRRVCATTSCPACGEGRLRARRPGSTRKSSPGVALPFRRVGAHRAALLRTHPTRSSRSSPVALETRIPPWERSQTERGTRWTADDEFCARHS